MFNSTILDVTIGMIFIYLLLSLICSAVNEILEAFLKQRAAQLLRGLKELLQDPKGEGAVKLLYDHGLINGLFKGKFDPNKSRNLPSYIPARNFALALMDVILPATSNSDSGAAGATASTVSPDAEAGAVSSLRKAIKDMTIDDKAKTTLLTLVDAAGNDMSKVRENIENWYNSSMDRVAGWYKRHTQLCIGIIGLLVAGFGNVDSIAITKSLAQDKPLRDSLAAAAQEYAKKQPETNPVDPQKVVKETATALEQFSLPIGWNSSTPNASTPNADTPNATPQPTSDSKATPKRQWPLTIFGWLITAAAISLGAPFWFDLLNKIMIVRSTVKPHEKSPEEKSRG